MDKKKSKTVTFDMLNEISLYLFRHQNKKPFPEVQSKVALFFSQEGNDKFIEVYDDLNKTKDYIKALDTFKI
jgi:hypothetical protein